MTKIAALLGGVGLAALIGGTAAYTLMSGNVECDVASAVGSPIGGPFELVNAQGELVTDADVIDRPALVYFGYTFCPDVCPFDVARNALATDLLEEQGEDVALVFVTIDPERDTPEVLADYAEDMHPDMVALTGSPEQVKQAADAYRAYYARGSGDEEFYLMAHSNFTYLMLPGNELATFFRAEETPEGMAEKSACMINAS
ncbi:SCO family protein [Rhodobacteraceae bacterium]|nr:SCO family protein [Paracoccaceae bacterium]